MTISEWMEKAKGLWNNTIKQISDELAIVAYQSSTARESMLAGSGGVGYSSILEVFYKGEVLSQSWQTRDRYNPDLDRPDLYINRVDEVEVVDSKPGETTIRVQVWNWKCGHRWVTFGFKQ